MPKKPPKPNLTAPTESKPVRHGKWERTTDTIRGRFSSFKEFADSIDEMRGTETSGRRDSRRESEELQARFEERTKDWFGRDDLTCMSDAVLAVPKAHDPSVKMVRKFVKEFDSMLEDSMSISSEKEWSEHDGDEFDFDRIMGGQPFWMSTEETVKVGTRNIVINVLAGANSMTKATPMLRRAAGAVALAKKLEEAGYQVEINSVHCSSSPFNYAKEGPTPKRFITVTRLKDFDGFLNPVEIANGLSPWAFRVMGFAALRQCEHRFGVDVSYTLGSSFDPNTRDGTLDFVTEGVEENVTDVINIGRNELSEHSLVTKIKNFISKLNKELEELNA